MTVYTDTFRKAHAELQRADRVDPPRPRRGSPSSRSRSGDATLDELLEFLHGDVEPHTRYDERYLYPEVAARLGAPLATASMNYDHVAIRQWIAELEATDRVRRREAPGAPLRARRDHPRAHLEGERALPAGRRLGHLARLLTEQGHEPPQALPLGGQVEAEREQDERVGRGQHDRDRERDARDAPDRGEPAARRRRASPRAATGRRRGTRAARTSSIAEEEHDVGDERRDRGADHPVAAGSGAR